MFKPTVGFVGMSHLGLNYAVASAKKKLNVICFDENNININLLKKKKSIVYEKDLEKNLKNNFSRLKFTNRLNDLSNCDNVFISLDVKTDNKGKSDLTKIKELIKKTLRILNKKANLIILCQVPPGFSRQIKWPKNQLYYQVETLIFGQAMERALNPERIIIGSVSKSMKINKNYKYFLNLFRCPIFHMNYESAELAKISINMFLISTLTTTNILSEICEKINANWEDISNSLKLDKRIGKYAYLKPGLGISGGNLERDIVTLSNLQNSFKLNSKFLNEIIEISKKRKNWITTIVNKLIKKHKNPKISVLGLTYKAETHSIKNSPSIQLINKLKKYKLKAYDPVVKNIKNTKNIKFCKNISQTIYGCDFLIIATPWKKFKTINYDFLKKNIKKKIIIDPFGLFDSTKLANKGLIQITMGQNKNAG